MVRNVIETGVTGTESENENESENESESVNENVSENAIGPKSDILPLLLRPRPPRSHPRRWIRNLAEASLPVQLPIETRLIWDGMYTFSLLFRMFSFSVCFFFFPCVVL